MTVNVTRCTANGESAGLSGRPDSATTIIHGAGHRVDNEAAFRWLSVALEKRP